MRTFIFSVSLCICAYVVSAAFPDERPALMDLFTSTNGAYWTRSDGWNTSLDYCQWFGVDCEDGQTVTCVAPVCVSLAHSLIGWLRVGPRVPSAGF